MATAPQASDLKIVGNTVELRGKPITQASYLLVECAVRQNLQDGLGDSQEPWVLQYDAAMNSLDDVTQGVTSDPSEISSTLQQVAKQIFTIEQLQAQDFTYTQPDQLFYLNNLRAAYKTLRTQHPVALPSPYPLSG